MLTLSPPALVTLLALALAFVAFAVWRHVHLHR